MGHHTNMGCINTRQWDHTSHVSIRCSSRSMVTSDTTIRHTRDITGSRHPYETGNGPDIAQTRYV